LNIYLIRHTIAEAATHLKRDRERELTEEGIKTLKESINNWKSKVEYFDIILSSPFKRAVRTAEIIADSYNYKDEILNENSLASGSTTFAIIQLAELFKKENIAFVGHQPDIGNQVSTFISDSEVNLKISPASIIKISFEGNPKIGKGVLKFLLPPVNLQTKKG